MDGLENGWINRLRDIQIHGWTEQDGLIYRQTNKQTDRHTHTHTHNTETDEQVHQWIDSQTGRTHKLIDR